MGFTITEKILRDHCKDNVSAGDFILANVDKCLANDITAPIAIEVFEKIRDVKTGEIKMSGSLNLKDKDVVISDDIIATGGTMATAIKLAKDSGAKKVFALATHALMLGQAKFRILKAGADEIIGTDSIDNEVCKISLAKVIADYLK